MTPDHQAGPTAIYGADRPHRTRRSVLTGLAAAGLAAPLAGCGALGNRTWYYRYRMTVEVDTPEGVRSGSSVFEVRKTASGRGKDSFGAEGYGFVSSQSKGQAVVVDMPGNKVLIALLRAAHVGLDPGTWVPYVGRPVPTRNKNIANRFDEETDRQIAVIKSGRVIPYERIRKIGFFDYDTYPWFCTFADQTDPMSIKTLDVDQLDAYFGNGTRIRRIYFRGTADPVSFSILDRYPFLKHLDKYNDLLTSGYSGTDFFHDFYL